MSSRPPDLSRARAAHSATWPELRDLGVFDVAPAQQHAMLAQAQAALAASHAEIARLRARRRAQGWLEFAAAAAITIVYMTWAMRTAWLVAT